MSNAENRPERIEAVIATKVRVLREAHGLTQSDLAGRVRAYGLDWSRSAVAALENGNKDLDLTETAILALTLQDIDPKMTFVRLVTSEGPIAIGSDMFGPGDMIASIIGGKRFKPESMDRDEGTVAEDLDVFPDLDLFESVLYDREAKGDAEMKAARRLGVKPRHVAIAARRLWGRSLTAERDDRVQAGPDKDLRAARGHVTRQLMDELSPTFKKGADDDGQH